MFLLIDRTNMRPLARHESYLALAALSYIQFANVDANVFRCGSDGQYGPMDNQELRAIAASMGVELPASKRPVLIKAFRELVENAEYLDLPFTVQDLVTQARQIEPADSAPYAYNPNGEEPDKLRDWHCAPNRNRPRWECQHWIHFTSDRTPDVFTVGQNSAAPWNASSGDGTIASRNPRQAQKDNPENNMAAPKKTAPKAPAKKATAPKAPAAKTPKAAKAPKAPKPEKVKVERIEANGVKRPKAGTTGDTIWSAADTLSAKKKSPATFAEVQESLGDTVNEASMRAGYQRWRKFNGLKGRLASE